LRCRSRQDRLFLPPRTFLFPPFRQTTAETVSSFCAPMPSKRRRLPFLSSSTCHETFFSFHLLSQKNFSPQFPGLLLLALVSFLDLPEDAFCRTPLSYILAKVRTFPSRFCTSSPPRGLLPPWKGAVFTCIFRAGPFLRIAPFSPVLFFTMAPLIKESSS